MRREYARFKVDQGGDPATLRANLMELARLDPLNAGPWIRLGDLSLKSGTLVEANGHYQRALGVLEERRRMFAEQGAATAAEAVTAERVMIRELMDMLPHYFSHRETLVLRAEVLPQRRYVLMDRLSGCVIKSVAAPARIAR